MTAWLALPEEFDGFDVAWVASDRLGQVGLFITAGQGSIPDLAVASATDGESEVLALPKRSLAKSRSQPPVTDAFVRFAHRGVFVYDWSDVHRTNAQCLHAYELMATPLEPLRVDALPPGLRAFAEACRLDATFGATTIAPTLVSTPAAER